MLQFAGLSHPPEKRLLLFEFVPYPLLFGLAILCVSLVILKRQKRSYSYLLCFSVFWMYLLVMVSAVLFPIPLPADGAAGPSWQSADDILARVNLIPFYYGQPDRLNAVTIMHEIAGNIALTVPFGFGINFIRQITPKNIPWLALGVGVGTEATQLIACLVLGMNFRSVDINDMMLNAMGVLIGYGAFRIFSWLYLAATKLLNLDHKGLFAYIHAVASRA